MHKVCIIGVGWLGFDLAKQLSQQQYEVCGTVRQEEKAKHFSETLSSNIASFDIYQSVSAEEAKALFSDSIVVINIAAGRLSVDCTAYSKAVLHTIKTAFSCQAKKVIFISTTSVFAGKHGAINNTSQVAPISESGRAHVAIEQHLQQKYLSNSTVLSLSGLVGFNRDGTYRHPILTLSKKGTVSDSQLSVNLIHKTDVIRSINAVIENNIWGETLNLCSLDHPTKAQYYSWCAEQFGLTEPLFEMSDKPNRFIIGEESFRILGVEPAFSSPYDMVPC